MRIKCYRVRTFVALLGLTFTSILMAASPDLTEPGVIDSINRTYTYNLGPTGLRGWIYVGGGNGADGKITVDSRQILVTVASAPANEVLAVDDVILGVMAADSGSVPLFTNDCRKAFGMAIGEAEKSGAGTLRVKFWRAGATNDVNISMPVMGEYSSTMPYSCPKSALILTNAVNNFVAQLMADPNFLGTSGNFARSIHALALLSGVTSNHPNYGTVQTRLQTYAHAIAANGPATAGLPMWGNAYSCLFLSEYYLSTGDTNVLSGLNNYSVSLANSQSMYGTFGHDPALGRPGSSGRHNIGYGPVNQVGIIANMGMVMGKKALEAGGRAIDPEITSAIQRGNAFFAWYVNKGTIPYGEHDPGLGSRESNGKEGSCAVLFGLQNGHATETEYFTRLAISGFNVREFGHTGQGFSYLWETLGVDVGGSLATAEYLKNVRWHLDLSRRTDGSFAYDGQEQYGPGTTADGTYLGTSSYNGLQATASYILTYSLPLKRLYITGKNPVPGNTLDATKVAHAISSEAFKQNCPSLTIAQLLTALSDFDPVVRSFAAIELGKRPLSAGELSTLRGMVTDTNASVRMAACETLGFLKEDTALPMLVQRLDKTNESNSWVRAKAANAIRYYDTAQSSVHLNTLLTNFVANATDPDVIDWDDPLQYANGNLGFALFGDAVYGGSVNNGASLAAYTINAPENLLYPAIQTGLKSPESKARVGPAKFCYERLTLNDVQSLIPDIIDLAKYECKADRMWGASSQAYGIQLLGKYKIMDGIPLALSMLEVPPGFTWGAPTYINPALDVIDAYGDAARWALPQLRRYRDTWDPGDNSYPSYVYPNLLESIASIENAITAPAQNLGLAVAHSQIVSTTGTPIVVTLAGTSPRRLVRCMNVTAPAHGTLTGTAPKLTYTPLNGYTGVDRFTFQVTDVLTTSETATVSIIVGTAGTGLKGEYYDNPDFTNLQLTRTDAQIDFDWGTGSPDASLGTDTFSVRWSGALLVPETGNYMFSSLSSEGMRLLVNGTPVIDNFTDQSTCWTDGTPINLIQGQLADIHIEYYENTNNAVAKLKWTGPSFAGVNGAIVPQSCLFDGSTITNRPAFAFPQNLTTDKNTALPITLNGSGGILTYTVLTTPTNGVLSGTAPNLAYTPNTDFTGTDSFTFEVNNGTTNSLPATITLGVQVGPLTHFTWATATSGNWSEASQWTPGAPVAAGQPNYALNFNVAGTYTATHNLNSGFLLNRLNVAGTVTLAGMNGLSFVANGSAMPQLNQNSANSLTINPPLHLAATTTLGASHAGLVTVTGLISGSGGLVKNSLGTLQINQFNNTYTGGTVLNTGIVNFPAGNGSLTPHFGSGPITINPNATLGLNRTLLSNTIHLNGCRINGGNGYLSVLSGPITLTGNTTINMGTTGGFEITGNISGPGGLTTIGTTQWTMTGSNTYTGPTVIKAGSIRYQASTAVPPGPLVIENGGKADLNFSDTRSIASLTLNGTTLPPGTYGSTASAAANKNDTFFSGTGIMNVIGVNSNSVPNANGQGVTTPVNTAKGITLIGSDPENTPLTYTIVTQPANGSLTGTPPNVNYTPETDYAGIDSFTFKVNDGTNDSAVALVSIAVATPNRPPVVNAGTNQIVYMATPFTTGWSFAPWTGDADSGISSSYVYTAKHSFGNNHTNVTVNGVTFAENFNTSGTGWSIAGEKADLEGNDDAVVGGESEKLAQEFIYNGSPRTVTFTGLTPGHHYEATFFSVAWEDSGRTNTFSTPRVTSANINQSHYGNNKGIRISCSYVATSDTQTMTITPGAGGTFHLYAMANRSLATASVNLAGSASDPDEDPFMTLWSVVSPTNATVIFGNAAVTNTTATFATEGQYVLRLSADDGYSQSSQDVTMTAVIPTVTAPTGFVATAVSSTQINLAWTDANVHETGFLIERSATNATGFTVLGTTAANATAYSDTTVGPGETWYYRVTATNTVLSSTPSDVASATTPKLPATVEFGNLSQTYNGTARTVSYTTTPTGLAVTVTYNGQLSAPTNAGTYAVTGTVVNATCQGTTNATLVVSKATPMVTKWPNAGLILPGQALSAGTLTDGTTSVPGTFVYDAPATVPPAGIYVAAVTFTPTESGNYSNVVGTVNVTVANPYILPFYESFEARITGNLNGQYGWVASYAGVQESVVFAGTKACSITNEAGIITHTFSDGRTKVWADMRVKIAPSVETPVPFTNSTANVFVLTNGLLMAFHGKQAVSTGTTVGQGAWVHLMLMTDYTAKTWDLYVNAYKVGRYGFYNTNVTVFTEYGIKGGNSVLDNLAITTTAPAGLGGATILMFR